MLEVYMFIYNHHTPSTMYEVHVEVVPQPCPILQLLILLLLCLSNRHANPPSHHVLEELHEYACVKERI